MQGALDAGNKAEKSWVCDCWATVNLEGGRRGIGDGGGRNAAWFYRRLRRWTQMAEAEDEEAEAETEGYTEGTEFGES